MGEPTAPWPADGAALVGAQLRLALAARAVPRWEPDGGGWPAGGCFLAFARGQAGPGGPGDHGWAAAVVWPTPAIGATGAAVSAPPVGRRPDRALTGSGPAIPRRASDIVDQAVVAGTVPAAYRAGLLALREGPLLEQAVRALRRPPEVLLVDATGLDHPRRAGLAVHLGAMVDVPTVGVTHRPLLARGGMPGPGRGSTSPLTLDGTVVGHWVRTRSGARPVVAHAGWRTTPEVAAEVVLACSDEAARTPVPLLEARRVAREVRAEAEGRVHQGRRAAGG